MAGFTGQALAHQGLTREPHSPFANLGNPRPNHDVHRFLLVLLLLPLVARAEAPCAFCGIIDGTRPAVLLHRDERIIAFMDRAPRNPGHVLIVPLQHAENYLDVPPETLAAMAEFAQAVGRALRRTDLRCEGINLTMNTGRAAGQSVFHAHLHVIPRFAGDARPHTESAIVPPAELEAVAAKLRAALASQETPEAKEDYALPPLGEEVPLSKIREICAHYGLRDLWRKIERDPPTRPFRSDGCTGWFDEWRGKSLYPAGFLHDLKYWAGYPGEDVERLVADSELMRDVARILGSTEMAETMFHGVRLGGTHRFKLAFSWGFGRQPEKKPER